VGVVYNEPDPGSRITQADMARNYSAQFHLNFPVSYAPRPTVLSFIEASVMDRLMFPHVVVVDKTGKVRAESKIEGTADLQSEPYLTNFIGGLLKEGAASSSTATKKAPAVAANATK